MNCEVNKLKVIRKTKVNGRWKFDTEEVVEEKKVKRLSKVKAVKDNLNKIEEGE